MRDHPRTEWQAATERWIRSHYAGLMYSTYRMTEGATITLRQPLESILDPIPEAIIRHDIGRLMRVVSGYARVAERD